MSSDGLPSFIYGGTAKAASTWLYECLKEHPEVAIHPDTDSLHYFDINYHRGFDWYTEQFDPHDASAVIGEITTSYLNRSPAPSRIATRLPNVTLLFCLRNPIERAFSHWWHGKSRGYWDYEFNEIFDYYLPYQMWVKPGFYASHLTRFDRYFDQDQLNVFFFDDIKSDSKKYIQEVFSTIGVDETFVPTRLGEKSNSARGEAPDLYQDGVQWVKTHAPEPIKKGVKPVWERTRWLFEDRSTYETGMESTIRRELEEIYAPDIKRLSERTGRSLDHWLEYIDLNEIDAGDTAKEYRRLTR